MITISSAHQIKLKYFDSIFSKNFSDGRPVKKYSIITRQKRFLGTCIRDFAKSKKYFEAKDSEKPPKLRLEYIDNKIIELLVAAVRRKW